MSPRPTFPEEGKEGDEGNEGRRKGGHREDKAKRESRRRGTRLDPWKLLVLLLLPPFPLSFLVAGQRRVSRRGS
jgi:hypothetical protein